MPDIARLRVEIADVAARVVRRIEVPLDMRLDDLHFVLQIAIGWQNCHPFEFRAGGKAWGLPDRDAPETSPLPADQATLADLIALGPTFAYDYVFGEDWQHHVELEGVAPAEPGCAYPRLIAAEGRCPPADIGGPSGYESYLTAIADPRHPLHETMIDWDDPDFDPAAVDAGAIAGRLAQLAKYIGRRKPDAS